MSRKDHMKASDVFRETDFFFGQKVSFREAFPQIKDLRIEVQTLSKGSEFVEPSQHASIYTMENTPGEYVDCQNPICYRGGFSIGEILRDMVREKRTTYEGTEYCKGYEGSPKGRRKYGSCMSRWKARVTLEYKQSEGQDTGKP